MPLVVPVVSVHRRQSPDSKPCLAAAFSGRCVWVAVCSPFVYCSVRSAERTPAFPRHYRGLRCGKSSPNMSFARAGPCGNAALFKIRDCCFIDEPLMLRQFSRYGIAEHHLGINQFIQRFAVLQGKQRRGDAVFAKAASQNRCTVRCCLPVPRPVRWRLWYGCPPLDRCREQQERPHAAK